MFPDLYKECSRKTAATPGRGGRHADHLHYEVVMERSERPARAVRQNRCAQVYADVEIESYAEKRGLFVGVEYHKRFDAAR